MSLSRLALRLATLEALRPTSSLASDGPWPTLAGKHVYDSRLAPLEDLSEDEARPIIVVYTDDDDGMSGQKRGGPPFLMTVDLCFEISVIAKVKGEADPAVYELAYPFTDPELETSLDLLGAQIFFALLYAPGGKIWRNVSASRVQGPKSVAYRSSEEAARIARRHMTWKVEVNGEHYDAAPASTPSGLQILPEPLRSVACALPANSYGAAIIAGLIEEPTFPGMPVPQPLQTVGLNVKAHLPGAPIPAEPNITGEVDNLQG